MLKRLALLSWFMACAGPGATQEAPAPADTADAEAADATAAAPLASRAVMTGEQVIRILDETVDWYRMLGLQQQAATQPSDLLILYANRQTAERVVGLAFEIARANAELLSSQAEIEEDDASDPASPQALAQRDRELEARARSIRAEIAATQREIDAAPRGERGELQAQAAELQSELDLVNARRNLLDTMVQFAHESDADGSGASTLKAHIDAIAATIPASSDAMLDAVADAPAAGPAAAAEQAAGSGLGIWDLGANVLRLRGKINTIDEVDRRTETLQETFEEIRAAPDEQIRLLSERGDALAGRPRPTDPTGRKRARDEYDTLAWLFSQTSSIVVPLAQAGVLLDQYRTNLDNWRDAARSQFRSALKVLAVRAALLALLLGAVFAGAELWRRAVFNYVQDPRRRHQLLLVRRVVMWLVALVIIGITLSTEASSFATFAGLLTAGIAVAMQSVLVSIVGYFFLVGKYGLRVGDRVQIGAVNGEVIDLGLVRLHLMELGPQHGPTGRVVAFANSVVFQAAGGIFKQIPGVNMAWREITLAAPEHADSTLLKQRLRDAAARVLDDYRAELQRQTHELRKTSSSRAAEEVQAHVQLRFAPGGVDAIVRYPVPLERAAEVEERMSRELIGVMREISAEAAMLTAQPV